MRRPKKRRVQIDLEMPVLPLPQSTDGKVRREKLCRSLSYLVAKRTFLFLQYYLARMPPYVDIETKPFDPDTFDCSFPEDATEEEIQFQSIREIEKTVRWRTVTDEHGNQVRVHRSKEFRNMILNDSLFACSTANRMHTL